jgi:hypothetical protein
MAGMAVVADTIALREERRRPAGQASEFFTPAWTPRRCA